jgi:phenylalanyl-tRNA synthetase beta chain
MKVSYNWLREMIDVPWAPKELAHRLIMVGLEVAEIIERGVGLEKIVVGHVQSKEKHPQADRLSVCMVDIGTGVVQMVCGAPNVAVGQKVAVVLPGTTLPNGLEIKPAKLRGVESQGMICSEKELGLAENADGILVLPTETPTGRPLLEVLPLRDSILELELTPNRPDCFSHMGIAQEVRALTGLPLCLPLSVSVPVSAAADFKIEIENPADCSRYCGRVVHNVTVGASPFWLRNRLAAVGLRSINNVVDITNYVLMELGHPLHAFDLDRLTGNRIVVRRARANERITSLDQRAHALDPAVLVIADAQQPVALAGIMGGAATEVTSATKNLFIESACFNPTVVRQGARKLGFSTEASLRFERGMDANRTTTALDHTVALIRELDPASTCVGATIDVYPRVVEPVTIQLRHARVEHILGVTVAPDTSETILQNLGCGTTRQGSAALTVRPPTRRVDLVREIDLIEEVARIVGYDNIPPDQTAHGTIEVTRDENEAFADLVRTQLVACGYQETATNTLVRQDDTVLVTPAVPPVVVRNAISRDMDALRTSLWTGLLAAAAWNLNRQNPDVRFFEVGKVFTGSDGPAQFREEWRIAGLLSGCQARPYWQAPSGTDAGLFDLKGVVEGFCRQLGMGTVLFSPAQHAALELGGARIECQSKPIGYLGQLSPRIAGRWDIKRPIWGFELDGGLCRQLARHTTSFVPLPKFPPLLRDLSILADRTVPVGDLVATIRQAGQPWIRNVELFDLYQGDAVPAGQRSLTFAIEYLDEEKTLNESAVESLHQKIVGALGTTHRATLRAAV